MDKLKKELLKNKAKMRVTDHTTTPNSVKIILKKDGREHIFLMEKRLWAETKRAEKIVLQQLKLLIKGGV